MKLSGIAVGYCESWFVGYSRRCCQIFLAAK